MRLVVDAREPRSIREHFDDVEIKQLDVGDFQIVDDARGDAPVVVCERKTWNDFKSSVNGGRLSDQTARILELCRETDCRPILIFEDARVRSWTDGPAAHHREQKFVDCCLHKFALEGFSVLRSQHERHTADVVRWLLKRSVAGKIPKFVPALDFKTASSGVSVKKSSNATPEKTWACMLTAVRGVSLRRAGDIARAFPTAAALVEYFETPRPRRETFPVPGVGGKTADALRAALCGGRART